jgi:hypothetical protein
MSIVLTPIASAKSFFNKVFSGKFTVPVLTILLVASLIFGGYQYNKKWEQIRLKLAAVNELNLAERYLGAMGVQRSPGYSNNFGASGYKCVTNDVWCAAWRDEFASSSTSSSSYSSLSSNPFSSFIPSTRKNTLYGWIGGNQVKFEFQSESYSSNLTGTYFSSGENKTFDLEGMFKNSGYNTNDGTLEFTELDKGKVSGLFNFNTETPRGGGNTVIGLGRLYKSYNSSSSLVVISSLSGTYTDLDNNNYDVYLTANEKEIMDWKVETIEGELIKNSNQSYGNREGETKTFFIKKDDGTYILTRDTSKFAKIEEGKKVKVTGKVRRYNQGASGNIGQCNGGYGQPPSQDLCKYISAKDGIFNVTEAVEK